MSEDTLLNSEPSNETNETEQPSFLWAEGVAGQGGGAGGGKEEKKK